VLCKHPSTDTSNASWYLLSALAVISYTGNSIYVVLAASGSWIGADFSERWLERGHEDSPGWTRRGPEFSGVICRNFTWSG